MESSSSVFHFFCFTMSLSTQTLQWPELITYRSVLRTLILSIMTLTQAMQLPWHFKLLSCPSYFFLLHHDLDTNNPMALTFDLPSCPLYFFLLHHDLDTNNAMTLTFDLPSYLLFSIMTLRQTNAMTLTYLSVISTLFFIIKVLMAICTLSSVRLLVQHKGPHVVQCFTCKCICCSVFYL